MTIDGCPADCADGQAEAGLFSTSFEAAIGTQVSLAPENVEVTSVTVTNTAGTVQGLPSLTVLFVLKNVDDSNQKAVQKGLSSKDTAAAVGKALQGGGKGPCPKAQVSAGQLPKYTLSPFNDAWFTYPRHYLTFVCSQSHRYFLFT